jgi:hypothetical protein
MRTAKQLKAAIVDRRASKGPRRKRTRPEPRQYTVADLERARDRLEAAERRIDNDRTNNPNRGRAGLERAQLELHVIESQLMRSRGHSSCKKPSVIVWDLETVPAGFAADSDLVAKSDVEVATTSVPFHGIDAVHAEYVERVSGVLGGWRK